MKKCPNKFPLKACSEELWALDCQKRQQDMTYNIQQKTRQTLLRHLYNIRHWVFKKEKMKKKCEKKFFSQS